MIKEVLHDFAQNSNKVWESDRSQTVGASEVGQCLRKTYWMKNEGDRDYGAERDENFEDSWGARARGTIYEDNWWEPALKAKLGDKLKYSGKDQRTFILGYLSATPDGLATDMPLNALEDLGVPSIEEPDLLIECKTIDPRVNLIEPKPEHSFQAQVQIGMVRELTPHKPRYALLTYTNASFWDDIIEFPIRFDPKIFAVAQSRATQIMTAQSASDLRPEGWIAGGRECDYCPFNKPCGRERASVPDESASSLDPQFIAEISDLARSMREAGAEKEAAEIRYRELQHEIKERLRAKQARRIKHNDISVVWSSVKGRPSFDNKGIREAAAAAGVDISRFSTVGEPSDRLVVQVSDQSRSAA